MTFVSFRRPVTRSVHALDHLATLSDDPELCLRVSERTLYILQNLSTLDAIDAYQYAKSLVEGGYVPVAEEDDEWALYRSVCNALQIELIEGECMPTDLSHVWAQVTNEQSIPNNVLTTVLYNDVIDDELGEYDPETGYFTVEFPGRYHFDASVMFANSSAWNYGELASLSLYWGDGLVRVLGYERDHSGGGSKRQFLGGSGTVYVEEGVPPTGFRIVVFQNTGGALALHSGSGYSVLSIDRIL
jgi:hypothetical protein